MSDLSQAPLRFRDVVETSDALMGVKAVFGPLSSHMMCFGARGVRGSKAYYSVAKGAAARAVDKPFAIFIGGGAGVRDNLGGCVLNFARVSTLFGDTATFVDETEAARLAQWPVAVALHDVWSFDGLPHVVTDLGFEDRTILAGAQDGIIRPEGKVEALWAALANRAVIRCVLPLPLNFHDSGIPRLVNRQLPMLAGGTASEEGKRAYRLQRSIERAGPVADAARALNTEHHGRPTCEACGFNHDSRGMFDVHHPTPLAVGVRTTLPEHLLVLCPTCHRRAHLGNLLNPWPLEQLRQWVSCGRR